MVQATYSIRLDKEKKNQFDAICERLGLSASAAFSTFVNKTIEQKGLPYELRLEPKPSDYGIVEADRISRKELMKEIEKGLKSVGEGKTYTVNEVRRDVLGEQ